MSGFTPYSFTDAQLADIREYCGYPALGSGVVLSLVLLQGSEYPELEYRMRNISVSEGNKVLTWLGELSALKSAIPAAAANLDTDKAAIWTHNKTEVRERMNLYREWRLALVDYLGIMPGPALANGRGGNTVAMVV